MVHKNVERNCIARAYILDCESALKNKIPKFAEYIFRDYKPKILDFIKLHQNTCAVYELVCIEKNASCCYGYNLFCPRCMKAIMMIID